MYTFSSWIKSYLETISENYAVGLTGQQEYLFFLGIDPTSDVYKGPFSHYSRFCILFKIDEIDYYSLFSPF